MRRLLSAAASEARDFAAAWTDFWFRPADPATLAWLRFLTGAMTLYTHAVWSLRLEEFFAPDGWLPPQFVADLRGGTPDWSLWWLVPDGWLWPVHAACLLVLLCYCVGFLTPLTSKLAFGIVVSYAHRVPLATFGLDQISGFLTLYLAFAPCGSVGSVDWLLRRRREAKAALASGRRPRFRVARPSSAARLATRLIQAQLCVLYTYAGLAKLKGEAWWDGSAIWMAGANLEYQSGSLLWLAWARPLADFLTHATVVWELSFWALVWHRRLRPYVLAVGTAMHLGIGAFLGMWTFGLVMAIAYQAFVPAAVVRRAAAAVWRRVPVPKSVSVGPQSIGRAAWVAAFDALGRCRFDLGDAVPRVVYVDPHAGRRRRVADYLRGCGYDAAACESLPTCPTAEAAVLVLNLQKLPLADHDAARDLAAGRPDAALVLLCEDAPEWARPRDVVFPVPPTMAELRDAVAEAAVAEPASLAAV